MCEKERERGLTLAGSVSSVRRSALYPLPPSAAQRPSCHRHFAPLCVHPRPRSHKLPPAGPQIVGESNNKRRCLSKIQNAHFLSLGLALRAACSYSTVKMALWRFLIENRHYPHTPPSALSSACSYFNPSLLFPHQ